MMMVLHGVVQRKMSSREAKKHERQKWVRAFTEKLRPIHKTHTARMARKILPKIDRAYAGMVKRSKDCGVACTITTDDMRRLLMKAYGEKCRYCERVVTVSNAVFDHRFPISKGGPSTPENIQVICKVSNTIKGSLTESELEQLMGALQRLPDDLRKTILIRLSGGKR